MPTIISLAAVGNAATNLVDSPQPCGKWRSASSTPAAVHLRITMPPCQRFTRRAVAQPELSRRADRRPSHICDPRSPAPRPIAAAPFDSRAPWRLPSMLLFPNRTPTFGFRRMFLTQPAASRRSEKRVELLVVDDEPNLDFAWPFGHPTDRGQMEHL